MRRLDVPRFIEVLGNILAGDTAVRLVIPGHQDIWSREKLELWREYIVLFWTAVVEAHEKGTDLDAFLESHPLPKKYFYLESIGHDSADILAFHRRNIQAFWRQFEESAAEVLAQKIAEYGAEAAIKAFAQVRARGSDYVFDEYEFNALGYRLLFEGKTGDAVAVFTLNVDMFPESWNVYDSLGEALLKAGERDRAIELYRKSLELNPNNENGKEMLRRLGVTP
jgi:tetratricopeptide (TPR) repeat protein